MQWWSVNIEIKFVKTFLYLFWMFGRMRLEAFFLFYFQYNMSMSKQLRHIKMERESEIGMCEIVFCHRFIFELLQYLSSTLYDSGNVIPLDPRKLYIPLDPRSLYIPLDPRSFMHTKIVFYRQFCPFVLLHVRTVCLVIWWGLYNLLIISANTHDRHQFIN